MAIRKNVLSIGTNRELLWLRDMVLRNAGFKVLTLTDEKKAISAIQSAECGVLLLCYSLGEVGQQLAKKYRESCPKGRIVVITNDRLERPPVDADAFVYGVEGPEALIEAVKEYLEKDLERTGSLALNNTICRIS